MKTALCIAFWCFMLLLPNILPAQQRTISGTISDDTGATVPGATIMVKGTTFKTTSNEQGKFTINAPSGEQIVVVMFLGMGTKEVKVGPNDLNANISLATETRNLNEVVVVGYGTVKRSDVTGSVATLKGGDLNKTPASSVDQLLQGKIAGVQVTTGGGQPGQGATIRIRGASTLYGGKDPLVVVDGYPWGDAGNLKQINPDDIESMEVLKDASSAAIYGSRSANGVIMITTRKGRMGKPRITLTTLNTISTRAVKPDVWRNPIEEATYANEAAINAGAIASDVPYIGVSRPDGFNGFIYYPSIAELRGLDPTKPQWPTNTNWVDLVYRNPLSQSYTLSADGATEKTNYSISGNYYNEQGMVIKNGYEKYSGRLNLDQKLTTAISVGTNVVLAYTQNNGFGLGPGRSTIFPVYDTNGGYFKTSATDFGNPIALANQLLNTSKTVDFLGNIYANFKITDWLQFKSILNSKFGNSVQDLYDPINSTQRSLDNKGSFGAINNANYTDLLNENFFTINRNFGEDQKVTFLAGYSFQKSSTRLSALTGQNFVNDVLTNQNIATATTILGTNEFSPTTLASWYGRANYSLKDRYLLTLTARADGSSKFGSKNKWGYFPSGAIAWKASEESFVQSIDIISDLKFRVSYGLTGNQALGPFQTLDRFGSNKYWNGTAFVIGFGPGLAGSNDEQGNTTVGGLGNASLKWETTNQFDAGFDIGLLNQRFTLTADYYVKNTSDLLRTMSISPSAGYDFIQVNDGEISNKGFEIGLNAEVVRKSNFSWSLGANFSRNRNKVVAMGESNQIFPEGIYESVRAKITTFTVGQPLYSYYGFKTNGILQPADLASGLPDGLSVSEAQAGEIKYQDLDFR